MAKPLGQVVFKVPEFGKQGYELELRNEAREQREQNLRDRAIYRTGGEKAYNDNAYKLQGRYQTEVQDLYGHFEKLGTAYKLTNDVSYLRRANEVSNQIKQTINDYNTQVGVPLRLAASADTEQWQGYVGDRDDFDTRMEYVLKDVPHKIVNDKMHYLYDGEYVPKEQTPWGDKRPNEYNTVLVQETTKLGKFVVPSYYESTIKTLSSDAVGAAEANNAVRRQFEFDLQNNPTLAADVAVAYAIHKKQLPATDIMANSMKEVVAKYSDENAPAPDGTQRSYAEAANEWYLNSLLNLSTNRFNVKNQIGAQQTITETPTETTTEPQQTASIIPMPDDDEMFPSKPVETNPVATETTEEAASPIGPRQAEETVDIPDRKETEKTKDLEVDSSPEVPKGKEGMTASSINVRVGTDKKGKTELISVKRTLPEYYTDNLLDFEGGVSTDEGDVAALPDRNKDAPIINGKKAHTNKGVTYDYFKSWAKSIGIPKKDYKDRFLNLTNAEALAVAESIAAEKGTSNFKNPALAAIFTQNAWGGGGVYFKTSGTEEFKAILSMLKVNGIEPSKTSVITEKDAAKIDALFKKNPKQFLDDYFDAYIVAHSRLDKLVKNKKGESVPTWMVNRNGWTRRANEFKRAIAKEIGVKYEPITPYNETREYQKTVVDGKDVFTLVEKRGDEFVPVGKTDWVDSYQPIEKAE